MLWEPRYDANLFFSSEESHCETADTATPVTVMSILHFSALWLH